MAKARKQISLDKELVELAEAKGIVLSKFFNTCLKEEFSTSNEIEELKLEISEQESYLNRLRQKLCRIEKQKKERIDTVLNLDLAIDTIERIVSEHGSVADIQLKSIANYREVPEFELYDYCKNKKYSISRGVCVPKPTKLKNGHGFY